MIVQILLLALQGGGDLRAGASTVDVTPEKWPVVVNGMFTERSAARAHDRVYVRALVLDDGATRVALALVDSCMVPRDLLDGAKELAAKASGIPADRMLVSATHTHSAPAAMGCLGSDADPEYPAFLKPRIAQAIEKAAAGLVPAQAGWTVVRAPGHTFCRRWITRPDRMRSDPFGVRNVRANMHPGYQNPDFIGPSGPVDDALTLLSVRTREGKPLALYANFSMHYFGSPIVSADYFGLFSRKFAEGIGADAGYVAMMSQGTSGDLMWMDYGKAKPPTTLDSYSEGLTRIALEAYRSIVYRPAAPIAMREARLTLKRRVADEKRLAWAKEVMAKMGPRKPQSQQEVYAREQVLIAENPAAELKLQALRVGDLGITAIPNEVFSITGLTLKALSPLRPTMNIELANGSEGYIPPPEQHALGGYTTWAARTAGLEVEAEPRIVEALLKLLEEVADRPRRPFAEPESPYARAVLESKPAAYWRLGELAGSEALDSSGRGATAALEPGFARYLEGPPLAGEASVNRAVHLAGGRLAASRPGLGEASTVELWFWNGLPTDARPVTGVLLGRGKGGDVLGLGGSEPKEGRARLFFTRGETRLTGPTEIALKTWTHVALVRQGPAVRVYLNGRLEISGEAPPPSETSFFIGGQPAGEPAGFTFEGKVDEVSVYTRALAADEVAAHFKAAQAQ